MHLYGEKKATKEKKMREMGKKPPKSKVCTNHFFLFPSASKTNTLLETVNVRLKSQSKNAELNSFRKTC